MDIMLNEYEVRVMGCLIEKELTTPDYYPLTLNAVVNACNQKSNRNPVVSFDEAAVERALESLREKGLADKLYKAGSRVPKYTHSFPDKLELTPAETAVMCELMLRGPQTLGELRSRADRMHRFEVLEEVDRALQALMGRAHPLAVKMPRQPGRKENRYAHLLSGEPRVEAEPHKPVVVVSESERIDGIEEEVAALRQELEDLRQAFLEFKSQLE